MRKLLLAAAAASLFSAARAQADTILIINDYGTGQVTIPAYYVGGCVGNQCSGVDGYPYSIASNTIPNTTYIGDPSGNVSDMITFSAAPPAPGTCTPAPACNNEFTDVNFQSVSGLDMTGTPEACASVGGCAFIYNGSVQTVGTLTYGPPGYFGNPAPGTDTVIEYQSLIGTLLTATLTNFDGGSHLDPVLLPSNEPVGQVTGTIGGFGTEDYYSFYWGGGFFSATATVTNPSPNSGASYLFSEGSGNCTSGASATLTAAIAFPGPFRITILRRATIVSELRRTTRPIRCIR